MPELSGTWTLPTESVMARVLSGTWTLPDGELAPSGTAPTITFAGAQTLTTGLVATIQLTAGGSSPITWTLIDGTLPGTMAVSGATITGVVGAVGTYTVTLRATNSFGSSTSQMSITVNPANALPAITTSVVPNAVVDEAYTTTLAVSNEGSVTWSLLSGALPDGLSLNSATGVISGTPTTAQTRVFVARATNTYGTSDQPLSIIVVGEEDGWTRLPRDTEIWVRQARR